MTDDELAHFGIRGMKWGVRRGGLSSRVMGALSDQNQRQTVSLTRSRSGNGSRLNEKASRGLAIAVRGGTKRYNKAVDKNLNRLAEQRRRIEAGKLSVTDVLSIAGGVAMGDLLISTRDKRG